MPPPPTIDLESPFGEIKRFAIDEEHFLGAVRRIDKEVDRGQRFLRFGPILMQVGGLDLRQGSANGDVWYPHDRPGCHGLALFDGDRIVCSMVDRLSWTAPEYQGRWLTFKLGYLLMQAYPEIIHARQHELQPRSYTAAGEHSMRAGYRAFKALGIFTDPENTTS